MAYVSTPFQIPIPTSRTSQVQSVAGQPLTSERTKDVRLNRAEMRAIDLAKVIRTAAWITEVELTSDPVGVVDLKGIDQKRLFVTITATVAGPVRAIVRARTITLDDAKPSEIEATALFNAI